MPVSGMRRYPAGIEGGVSACASEQRLHRGHEEPRNGVFSTPSHACRPAALNDSAER